MSGEQHGAKARRLGARSPGVWSEDPEESAAAWVELGQQATSDGWSRHLLSDVLSGRLNFAPEAAVPALRVLVRRDPQFVMELLARGPETALAAAARALGQEGDTHLATLVALSQEREESRQMAAIAGLAELAAGGCVAAVEQLGALLRDPNGEVRREAAAALGQARGSGGVRRALSFLEHVIGVQSERALVGAASGAAAISAVSPRKAGAVLKRIAESGQVGQRAVAMSARAMPWRTARGVAKLLLGSADSEVQRHLVPALVRWCGEGSAAAHRELRRLSRSMYPTVRAAFGETLGESRRRSHPQLAARLARDPSALVRASVAPALAVGADDASKALLLELARDRAAGVRAAAVRGLGAVGEQEVVREACLDKAPAVRAAAASALSCREEQDVELLFSLLKDSHVEVAEAGARSLGRVEGALTGILWTHLVELASQPATRAAAAEGMAAALERSPRSLTDIWLWWPVTQLGPEVLWAIARGSRSVLVATAARTLAHVLEGAAPFSEVLREAAPRFRQYGRKDLARRMEWAAQAYEASTSEQIAALSDAPLAGKTEVWFTLCGISRTVKRALHAKEEETRQRQMALAREQVEMTLEVECDSVRRVILQRIARRWRDALGKAEPDQESAELRGTVTSALVVAGERPSLVITVENLGGALAQNTTIRVEGAEVTVGSLPPKGTTEAVVPLPAASVGMVQVQGEIRYQAPGGQTAVPVSGQVTAIAPGRVEARDNPYVVGKPLSPGSAMFFGRAAEMAFVERALAAGESGTVVVLVGHRRTGKTSLLKCLEQRLAGRFRPAFVDVQGMLVSGGEEFFREIAGRVVKGTAAEWMLDDQAATNSIQGPDMVSEAAAHTEGDVVLLLDEFDDLEQKVRSGRLPREVFGQLRSLIQHSSNLRFVLSGTHRLEQLAGEYWSFLLNLATYRRVGPLDREEAEEVIRAPLSRLGIVCEDAAVALAAALAGRQPYLLQLLGYRLVERCVQSGEGAVRATAMEAVAEEVVEQGDVHLRYLWEMAGRHGQPVLLALSEREGWVSHAELSRATGLGSGGLTHALETLLAYDLLRQQGDWFALQIGLLGRWLRKRRSGDAVELMC